MQDQKRARGIFLALWIAVTAIKLWIAARLPVFVDEAFYWQEGRHLALAYSDLPGLSAWLARIGTELGGQHALALRAPFLLLAAWLPWLVVGIARRWFGPVAAWQAGCLALLMPLSGALGLLALPDVPMAVAAVLCAGAGTRLLQRVDAAGAAQLALGLVIGALSHYRFIGVIGVGCVALLLLPQGRRVLADKRVWVALAMGAAAWLPLLYWNLDNADAGLRFQLVDRHPWSFHAGGWWFLPIQALLVTPLLFWLLIQTSLRAGRASAGLGVQARYLALLGGISTLGFFLLGFFADAERVSFHWPLPGYLALLAAAPPLLWRWRRGWRIATWSCSALGLTLMLGYYLSLSAPQWRAYSAAEKFHNTNFVGWEVLAKAVREELDELPPQARVLADNFKVAAELGFLFDDAQVRVLDHPVNHRHGRAPQLRLWGLQSNGEDPRPALLVVGSSEIQYKSLLAYYQGLCEKFGPLPPPRVVNVDHGRQRFLLFALPAQRASGACVTPAFAWIDTPASKQAVAGAELEVAGWAFKDGVGLRAVEILIDGQVMAQADYGLPSPGTEGYWKTSTDPQHPNVGFRAKLDLDQLTPGRHWLGLRLHGRDGSVEDWSEQPILLGP